MRKAFGVKVFVPLFLVSLCSLAVELKAQPVDLHKALDQRLDSFVLENGSISLAFATPGKRTSPLDWIRIPAGYRET